MGVRQSPFCLESEISCNSLTGVSEGLSGGAKRTQGSILEGGGVVEEFMKFNHLLVLLKW